LGPWEERAVGAIITLTTDFGTADGYVGAMKGVVLTLCRRVTMVDITHDISPHDVWSGALTLLTCAGHFPEDTIHIGVVDPGVGSGRRAMAVRTDRGVFVGPDNGLFTLVMDRWGVSEAVHLERASFFLPRVSATFHGRDVFAPVAAHLASGVPLEHMGPPLDSPVRLEIPEPLRERDQIRGQVIHVDRFGNLITNIQEWRLTGIPPKDVRVEWHGVRIQGLSTAYADVREGAFLALVGSAGMIEISRNRRRADENAGGVRGASVVVSWTVR